MTCVPVAALLASVFPASVLLPLRQQDGNDVHSHTQVSKEVPQPDMPKFAPAMVSDRIDIGSLIKYMLKFDDGVVSG